MTDFTLTYANINLFQETSLNEMCKESNYDMKSKKAFFNTIGHRKGIASFVPEHFQLLRNVQHEKYQISTIYSNILSLYSVISIINSTMCLEIWTLFLSLFGQQLLEIPWIYMTDIRLLQPF